MPVTTPPALSAIPAFPALSERAAGTYNANAYACLNHWAATGGPQLAALAANLAANANDAEGNASAAATAKTAAEQAQAAAEAASAATKWVSGTTYAEGVVVWSPADFASYRRKTTGAGTTDPSADSTNWAKLSASGGSWVLLSTVTASNSTTVDVETTFDSTYDEYVVVITGYRASVASGDLRARLKIGGAYDTASNYVYRANHSDSSNATFSNAVNASVSSKAAFIPVSSGNSATNAAGFALNAMVFISNPASTSLAKSIQAVGRAINSAGQAVQIESYGYNTGTAAMTGIRFYDWSGNLASGTFRLYGIKKS